MSQHTHTIFPDFPVLLAVQQGDCRLDKLEALIAEAEKKVVDFTAAVLNSSSGNANISPAQQKVNMLGHHGCNFF